MIGGGDVGGGRSEVVEGLVCDEKNLESDPESYWTLYQSSAV